MFLHDFLHLLFYKAMDTVDNRACKFSWLFKLKEDAQLRKTFSHLKNKRGIKQLFTSHSALISFN